MRTRPVDVILRHRRELSGPNLDELSDRELLHRYAASRDEEAFTLVVRRHGPMVLALCRRLPDELLYRHRERTLPRLPERRPRQPKMRHANVHLPVSIVFFQTIISLGERIV
jgi:hypothetical protein